MSGFQASVNQQLPLAVAGDPASNNPWRAVVSPVATGLQAGTGGVTVARFAWVQSDGTVLNAGSGVPDGFLFRELQAMITTYLAEAGNVVPAGFPVTLAETGDWWFVANTNAAVIGQKVFASLTTGATQTGAAGATISGFIETPFVVRSACLTGEIAKMSRAS